MVWGPVTPFHNHPLCHEKGMQLTQFITKNPSRSPNMAHAAKPPIFQQAIHVSFYQMVLYIYMHESYIYIYMVPTLSSFLKPNVPNCETYRYRYHPMITLQGGIVHIPPFTGSLEHHRLKSAKRHQDMLYSGKLT